MRSNTLARNVVYLMRFPSGDEYVGASSAFAERRRTHLRRMRSERHESPNLQGAHKNSGLPTIEPVAHALRREELHLVEAAVIEARSPALNVNWAPTPLPKGHEGARPWGPYPTIRAASEAMGISHTTMKRLSKLPYEAALAKLTAPKNIPPPKRTRTQWRKTQEITLDGISALPREHRARLGISESRAKTRRAEDRDPWKAPDMPTPARRITAAEKTATLSEWVRETGLNRSTICNRIDIHGWTPEQALDLDEPPMRPAIRLEHAGATKTLAEWAEELGTPKQTLYMRHRRGLSAAQVLGHDLTS